MTTLDAGMLITRLVIGPRMAYFMAGYDVSADGQRFVLNAPPEQPAPPITVLINWTAALAK